MKKKILVLLSFALVFSANMRSQVTIGRLTTPKAGALLDLNSTTTGGLVLSNVDLTYLSVIPANTFVGISTQQDTNQELAGMIVYNTYAANGVGVYVWDGKDWIKPCAPPAPGPITFSGTTICGSTFTAKIDSVKGATSYVWELPAGLTGTSNDTIITITGAVGTYAAGLITVRAVSSCGSGTRRHSTEPVTVGVIPAAPTDDSVSNSGNTFTFGATPPTGCTIDWYNAATGGTKVATGVPSYSTTISGTTSYYAESRNTITGCVSASRLEVKAVTIRSVSDCDVPHSYGGSIITNSENVRFTNDAEYTRNGITFSAPVKIVGRSAKTSLASQAQDNTLVDYRDHYDDSDTYGSWFTWCMVATHADILCPSPWRVPSREDFCKYANDDESNTNYTSEVKTGMHGWLRGGGADGSSMNNVDFLGFYWSSTEYSSSDSYLALVYSSTFLPSGSNLRGHGYSLRCVK